MDRTLYFLRLVSGLNRTEEYSLKILSLVNKLLMLWRAEKVWRKPVTASLLIYDRCGTEILFDYIKHDDFEILDIRGETINLYVMFCCIFSFELSNGGYANRYISLVNPSVIITFIDNNPRFYELKWTHPRSVTIFVPNGLRGEFADVFGILKAGTPSVSYQVDYMLTFGAAIGETYSEYINGCVVPIGSIKSNRCGISKRKIADSLVFVSQFTPPLDRSEQSYFGTIDSERITWGDFYSADRRVIRFLANYCERKKLILQVCGRSSDLSGEEMNFFGESIGDKEWEFIPRNGNFGSYAVIDGAELVVGIDSTLVYESLARGNKTGIFSVRSSLLKDRSAKFGWPQQFPENGPFWTNHVDEKEFERVLDYLISINHTHWEKILRESVTNLMDYDSGNTRFITLLKKLQIKIN